MRATFVLLLALVASGCDKPKPTTTDAQASAPSVTASATARGVSDAAAPVVPIDALESRLHVVHGCYFASLSIRQLRERYNASLGGKEPGEGRLPDFDGASKIDHEGNARRCRPAKNIREPAIAELDAAVAAYAPVAEDLAELIEDGSEHYALGRHKKDDFKKAREYHKKLVEAFAKLEPLAVTLGKALVAYDNAHPQKTDGVSEGERLTATAYRDARAVGFAASLHAAELGAATTKLKASVAAYDAWVEQHPTDPWAKLRGNFAEVARHAGDLGSSKGADAGSKSSGEVALTGSIATLVAAHLQAVGAVTFAKATSDAGR